MKIAGLQKLTLLDFPSKTACTVFTAGCNFRCPFCHNSPLIECGGQPLISEESFFAFLDKRKNLLDGVCISGGEPLLQKDIIAFCAQIKSAGFLLKLDTNGSMPNKLEELISLGLVDYIAMDLKNSRERYGETVGLKNFDISPIERSVDIIKNSNVDYEFRTTVVREFHNRESLLNTASWIEGAKRYFIQPFKDSENVAVKDLHSYEKSDLEAFKDEAARFAEEVKIRGL